MPTPVVGRARRCLPAAVVVWHGSSAAGALRGATTLATIAGHHPEGWTWATDLSFIISPGFYEPFNAISHLIATAVFAFLGWRLVQHGRGNASRVLFLSIYACSCVFLLAMSGVYHMMVRGTASAVLARLDHGAIFVLIAGTFTGVHGVIFRGWQRWVPLVIVWVVAAACIATKVVFFTTLPEWVGLTFYLGLGWGVALTAVPIFRRYGFAYLGPLIAGGLAYTIGAVMDYLLAEAVVVRGVIHSHEIWHLAVFAGALCHWRFVWNVTTDDVLVAPAADGR